MKRPAVVLLAFALFLSLGELAGCDSGSREIPMPRVEGKGLGGSIAFDGEHFWATRVPMSYTSKAGKEIVKFDRSGNEVMAFAPAENFSELTFDGKDVWTADAFGYEAVSSLRETASFYTVNPETGTLERRFSIHVDYMLDGLAAGEDRLWAFVVSSTDIGSKRFILEIDPHQGSVVRWMEYPDREGRTCSGMAYADGHLWLVAGFVKRTILKISPGSGKIVDRYDCSGRVINGITTDGKRILLADGETYMLTPMRP